MASQVSNPYLAKLIADLPEIYQPVYGHPELSNTVSRSCVDRLASIASAYDALQILLGRPLRVLDLGCAQGFFSLSLAERGASVYGVDFLDKNIEVCNALVEENLNKQASFTVDHIEDVLQRLKSDQYDLVLGLSVFHHIVHERGVGAVRDLLDHAAQCVGALIVEIALREEPLYWAPSQPENPRILLEGFAFVHEIARYETHLSPIHRPLYVASNRYWVLDGHAGVFESWTTEPHSLAFGTYQGTRRYYFCADYVVKMFRLDHSLGEGNRKEILGEATFLANPPSGFRAPACLISGSNETEAWLVLDRIPGKLLLDLIRERQVLDPLSILRDVIQQLTFLEAVGLYHDDVRTWNTLIGLDGKIWLIDYGSISPKMRDCVWPDNIYLAFFIFVREITTGVVEDPNPLRTISISPYNLPQPYRAWAMALWKRPLKEWSFKLMLELLEALPQFDQHENFEEPKEVWAKAMEKAVQAQKQFGQHLKWKLDLLENQQHKLLQPFMNSHARLAESMEKQIAWLQDQFVLGQESLKQVELRAQEQEQRAVVAETRAQEQEQRAHSAEARAQEQEQRAHSAEARAQEQEQRARMAESLAAEREQRVNYIEAQLQEMHGCLEHTVGMMKNIETMHQPSAPTVDISPIQVSDQHDLISISSLLAFHNEDFIHRAYRYILGRNPDADGFRHYLTLLRQGESKIEILGRLRYSPEGRKRKVNVSGLLGPFSMQRAYRLPFLGRLFHIMSCVYHLPDIERAQRSFEAFAVQIVRDASAKQQNFNSELITLLKHVTSIWLDSTGEKIKGSADEPAQQFENTAPARETVPDMNNPYLTSSARRVLTDLMRAKARK